MERADAETVRLLLSEVARRLRSFAPFFQEPHPASQRLRDRLQCLDTPVRSLVRPGKQPPNPRGGAGQGGANQLRRERREGNLMHEPSVPPRRSRDAHASGAYIIGAIRRPPPPAGTFVTTVLLGHTSIVAPSDVPSDFRSG